MSVATLNTWVVFDKAVCGKSTGLNAVCDEAEWNRLVTAEPGRHTLIKAGIATEGQAEQYARRGPVGRITCLSSDPHAR